MTNNANLNKAKLKAKLNINENKMLNLFVKNEEIKGIIKSNNNSNQIKNRKRNPVLVIKYGPPASGKGSDGTRKAIESLGVNYDKMLHLNIDDVIESVKQFEVASRNQLETTFSYMTDNKTNNNKKKQLENNLNKITNNKAKEFSNIYFKTRNIPVRNEIKVHHMMDTIQGKAMQKGIDISNFTKNMAKEFSNIYNKPVRNEIKVHHMMDTIQGKAMKKGIDISLETTGSFTFPTWLYTEPKLQPYINNYDVVFVFPTLSCAEGWKRYRTRPILSYLKNGPFRFSSTKKGYIKQYISSYQTFLEEMPKMMKDKPVSYVIVPNDKKKNNNTPPNNNIKRNNNTPRNNKTTHVRQNVFPTEHYDTIKLLRTKIKNAQSLLRNIDKV